MSLHVSEEHSHPVELAANGEAIATFPLRLPEALPGNRSRQETIRVVAQSVHGAGFDVAVDDADSPWGRDAQMVWAGVAENYLDPSALGVLSLGEADPDDVFVTLW